jgi:predicted lipoprotein with Yx(FWY)xxD motif
MTNHLTKHTVLAGAIALAALLSACSSGSKTTTAAGTSTTAASANAAESSTTAAPTTTQSAAQSQASVIAALPKVGAAAATGKTVSLAKGPQGIFLIGPDGRTLYIFSKDKGTTSACTSSECKNFWPPLTASGPLTAGPGITLAKVTTADGATAHQVAYYGHLLYYWKGDTKPGQTSGTSIADWFLLGPFGNVMLPHP